MDITFHYPPELMSLLIDTIPSLFRSKRDVLLFFRGAGVASELIQDLDMRVTTDRESITKFEIVRMVLTRLNERGEPTLRERREILKRITDFEDYSSCWENDRLKAMGLVGQIRQVVNVKDSFTRMNQEREKERRKHRAESEARTQEIQRRKYEIASIKDALFSLFGESDSQKRGKALEGVLNRLFKVDGILVSEAFTLCGPEGEGIIAQIDGVVEIDGEIYFVEMKWWKGPLPKGEASQHLVEVYHRGHARGILISASGYTDAAISVCKDALQKTVVILCNLEEFVLLLEQDRDLKEFLKTKIQAAMIDKNPLFKPL